MSIIEDYQQVRRKLATARHPVTLPEVHAGGFQLHTERYEDMQALQVRLQALAPIEGWYLWSSGKDLQELGHPLPHPQGWLLAAEARLEDQSSLQIRHLGAETWQLLRFTHDPQQADKVYDEIYHQRDGGGTLRYRRYFQLESTAILSAAIGSRLVAACFLGYGEN
ncbi:MAG: hypothetical protein U7M05_11990 [Candidatus Igneacidithiobacillus chanchocoensis]